MIYSELAPMCMVNLCSYPLVAAEEPNKECGGNQLRERLAPSRFKKSFCSIVDSGDRQYTVDCSASRTWTDKNDVLVVLPAQGHEVFGSRQILRLVR